MGEAVDQIHELDRKILALTEERFNMSFGTNSWPADKLAKWMDLQQQIDKLVEEKHRLRETYEHIHTQTVL